MLFNRISSSLAFRFSSRKRSVVRGLRKLRDAAGPQPESKYSRFVRDLESCTGRLEGKRLLEIGSDTAGNLLRVCAERGKVSSAVGVNPAIDDDVNVGQIQMLGADARTLPFPDSSFDVAASLSVFEHVFDLAAVLEECHRVLRPGGILFAEFGPIWSSSWGHHLWLYHGGEVVDWRTHPIPPYAHLLMEQSQLQAWCDERYGDVGLSSKIASFVFESDEQNRLFFSDYEEIIRNSSFDRIFLVGEPDVPFPAGTPDADYSGTFARLEREYPGKSGFGYHVVRTMLARRM